ncbi:MAG: DUF3426 domain-containing protein [Desulfuromonadales bacterium]
MIVECKACQTRFRLADEKVKLGGIKVRCSKCKEVFTVTLPEPEFLEEVVDFDFSNMERVSEDLPAGAAPLSEQFQADFTEPGEQPDLPPGSGEDSAFEASEQQGNVELDFSALESEISSDNELGEGLADDFSFTGTGLPSERAFDKDDPASVDSVFSIGEVQQEDQADDVPPGFSTGFEEAEIAGARIAVDPTDDAESDSETAERTETVFSTEGFTEPSEFSFDSAEEGSWEQEEPGELALDEDDASSAFSFDEVKEETNSAAPPGNSEPGEFSFDNDESLLDEDSTSARSEESSGDDTSFSFEEPQFETSDFPLERSDSGAEEGLDFGEIDFSNNSSESTAPRFQDDTLSNAAMPLEKEAESPGPSQRGVPSPSRSHGNEMHPEATPPKKSPMSRVLFLFVLLLASLGGAAGYLYVQEGSLNLNTIAKYLPYLQEYIGEPDVNSQAAHIDISITGSSYVNGQAGQMLVIQGTAVNNYPTTRSSITVKGFLLDAKGQPLLQQTVFCGNKIDDAALKSMTFADIEEAMNNQFGESLSNMNVASRATIPFTIVFRNLPADIAKINVEVVDSKPGAN